MAQLVWMSEAKAEHDWTIASAIQAATFNSRPGVKKSTWVSPDKLNPMLARTTKMKRRKNEPSPASSIESLAKAMIASGYKVVTCKAHPLEPRNDDAANG
jgi:hypothetical protein